ncbi:SURF1 family cytochrome oxidase biogenesis protein [Pontixanthobacter aquaemixtae]|uniref:SURF1-like protein n=1 Tax=Pontixanthobacter aquaemixtae TaxID=1958940 RepID=A0A844ZRU5_9SPHN|nr:SURF1 family protein [Pontixanthobacter aquaemixtae]MXO89726.1 SURF1 family protein [Pontixanthobacter aquaemixtae]
MSLRSIPLIPTILVVACAAIMVALGFWQLGRADEKELLLARYKGVPENAEPIAYPENDEALEQGLYRPTSANCTEVVGTRSTAGTNRVGAKGWAHIAQCQLDSGFEADIALGWSRNPDAPEWSGGEVTGTLAPGGKIVASPPLADLGPLAKPDPEDLPNNHMAYAVQWFLFALTALVIYGLALRYRSRKE